MEQRLFVAKQALYGFSHDPSDRDFVFLCYFNKFGMLPLGQADR
jgi:hypothetical protein